MQSDKRLSAGLMQMFFVCMALLLIACDSSDNTSRTIPSTATQHRPKAPDTQQIYIAPQATPDIQTFQ